MYFLKFLSNFIEKSLNDALKMPSNSLPNADLNLPEMKIKSPSCPAGGVHMYALMATAEGMLALLTLCHVNDCSSNGMDGIWNTVFILINAPSWMNAFLFFFCGQIPWKLAYM